MGSLERASSSPEQSALLKDLHERKQSIRRIASEVGSMATELRDVRAHMAALEANLQQETSRRQAAESRAGAMQKELDMIRKSLDGRNAQMASIVAVGEQVNLESMLETADASPLVAVQSQCQELMKELDMKNNALIEQETYAVKLGQQLMNLQQERQNRDGSQKLLKDEVEKMEAEMKLAVSKIINEKDLELQSSLGGLAIKNAEELVKHLSLKDEEISQQREELRSLSAQLTLKARELELQMDKHQSSDQDLEKRVLKLEFWLQQARNNSRKLQRVVERKEQELKDVRAQLVAGPLVSKCTTSFWGGQKFKIIVSVSAVALFVFAKR